MPANHKKHLLKDPSFQAQLTKLEMTASSTQSEPDQKKLMSATRKMSIMKNMSGDDKVSKYEVKVKFKKMQLFLDQSSTFKV